jgi:hypothetical protein
MTWCPNHGRGRVCPTFTKVLLYRRWGKDLRWSKPVANPLIPDDESNAWLGVMFSKLPLAELWMELRSQWEASDDRVFAPTHHQWKGEAQKVRGADLTYCSLIDLPMYRSIHPFIPTRCQYSIHCLCTERRGVVASSLALYSWGPVFQSWPRTGNPGLSFHGFTYLFTQLLE